MKAPVRIYLNGTLITGRIDGLDNLDVTITQNSDSGSVETAFTNELEFYDDGYAILKAVLIDDPNAFSNEVEIKIYDDCCAQSNLFLDAAFIGAIRADAIDWCEPICSIKANAVKKNAAYDCIQSKMIWEGDEFLSTQWIKLRYCVAFKPDVLLYFMFIVYFFVNIILFIPGIISSLAGSEWWSNLNARMILCSWYHPSAFVRSYVQNVCDKCGLNFKSSILNDPGSEYYNTLLFAAQVRKGYKPGSIDGKLIAQNLPVETLETLMKNHLMPLFNAKYWIVGNDFIFERKDYFDSSNVWIDAEQLYNDGLIIDNSICYSYLGDERFAFASYSYGLDGVDIESHEAKSRFDKIIEWNDPPSPTQKGQKEVQFLSCQARFRNDYIEDDAYSEFAESSIIDTFFAFQFSNSDKMMLMAQHTCTSYKFLIWDGVSVNMGRINRGAPADFRDFRVDGDSGNLYPVNPPNESVFNYAFVFREEYPGNLYSEYHYIDNPRLNVTRKFRFNFEFSFSCDQLNNFDFSKPVRLFKNNTIVFGEVTELRVDYLKRTIRVTGKV
jgi:hypothetical protein